VANTKQILALMQSRAEGDDVQFESIVLQVAASEARKGHRNVADELRKAVDLARSKRSNSSSVTVPFAAPRGELDGLLELRKVNTKLSDVILSKGVSERLDTILLQQRKRDWLREHSRTPNRHLLFVGPPGAGKTMTAGAIAGELNLPFYIIRLEAIMTRYMGETAAKLRLIFNETLKRRAVYFFDEFDAIGARRNSTNDVAEMRRVLNSFLMFLEEPSSTDSMIVGATNHSEILDLALIRRFDDVLEFSLPSASEIKSVIKSHIRPMKYPNFQWKNVVEVAKGLSQAEIARATEESVKMAILNEIDSVSDEKLIEKLSERQSMKNAFRRTREIGNT
jgi:SpoVK/Ycf46/Vps4 family AAA+-type ATPase